MNQLLEIEFMHIIHNNIKVSSYLHIETAAGRAGLIKKAVARKRARSVLAKMRSILTRMISTWESK